MPTPTFARSNDDESELAIIEAYETQFKVVEDTARQIEFLISEIKQSVGQSVNDDLKILSIKKSFTDGIIGIEQIKTAINLIEKLAEIEFRPNTFWKELVLDRDGSGGLSQDRWEWIRTHKAELVEFNKLNTLIPHIEMLGGGLRNIVTKELNRERTVNYEGFFEGNKHSISEIRPNMDL